MRLLFAKHSLVWPRISGQDVHTYYMMRACGELGHEVALATSGEPTGEALRGLDLSARFTLDTGSAGDDQTDDRTTWLQRRFRSYYGVPKAGLQALGRAATQWRADAVIVVGLDGLPYFSSLKGVIRVWYAADEWVWHHLSQLRLGSKGLVSNIRDAALKGVYERAHAGVVDRVWVVSPRERLAMRWLAGMPQADVLPNGVDADYFSPGDEPADPATAVFWGRLDFGPNVQALDWFCRRVWPLVLRRAPHGRFTIIGYQPSDDVRRLATIPGVTLVPNLRDLRSTVRRHALAVMPFVSGGGIKNKLLEAAALGLPIIGTPRAMEGLRAAGSAPMTVAATARQMSDAIADQWSRADRRHAIGAATRAWVLRHHTWTATARDAIDALGGSSPARRIA